MTYEKEKKMRRKYGNLIMLGILLFFVCAGCSKQETGSDSSSKIPHAIKKQDINGYWESSSEKSPSLEISNNKDVIVGVHWSRFWTGETGIFENVGILKKGEISGTDSESNDEFLFNYEMKSNKLIVTVGKTWLPSVFKDSNDKDKLTYKEGQKFIYNKTEKKEESTSKEKSSSKEKSTKSSALTDEYIAYYMQREGSSEKSVIASGYGLKLNTQGTNYVDVQNNEGDYFAQITELPKEAKITKESFGKGEKNISVYRNGSLIAEGKDLDINTQGTNYIDVKSPEEEYLSQITDLNETDIITIEVH